MRAVTTLWLPSVHSVSRLVRSVTVVTLVTVFTTVSLFIFSLCEDDLHKTRTIFPFSAHVRSRPLLFMLPNILILL